MVMVGGVVSVLCVLSVDLSETVVRSAFLIKFACDSKYLMFLEQSATSEFFPYNFPDILVPLIRHFGFYKISFPMKSVF